jgi:ketosteroid isomerase-like protein
MSEAPTMPDRAELLAREQIDALDRGDIDGILSTVTDDTVFDGRAAGDFYEGRASIRRFLEGWFSAWEELDFEIEEIRALGGGVVFAVVIQDGRPVGGHGHVRQREGWVYLWMGESVARLTIYEVDDGRAAAERLARERG